MLLIFGRFIPRPTVSVAVIAPALQILVSLLSVEINKYDDSVTSSIIFLQFMVKISPIVQKLTSDKHTHTHTHTA